MKFLVESQVESAISPLIESVNGEKKYFIEGIFAQAELKNRNGRLYPKKVLEKAVNNFQSTISSKRAIGELNHPAHPTPNPERASHLIQKLEWDNNNVMGKAKILTSLPMGKIAKGLIDEGVSFGVSTRGMGSMIESKDSKIVKDDYVLNTIDIVSDPSGINCFVDGIMEGQEWIFDAASGDWKMAEQLQSKMKKMSSKDILEHKAQLFEYFLNSLR